jgi:signal transduction histidine kinase
MRRLWPPSLAAQLVLLLLLALALAQAVSLLIYVDERQLTIEALRREQVLGRLGATIDLLARAPPELHERLLRLSTTPQLRIELAVESAVDPREPAFRRNWVQRRLARSLGGQVRQVLVDRRGWAPQPWRPWHDSPEDEDGPGERGRQLVAAWLPQLPGARPPVDAGHLVIAIQLADGRWLNARAQMPPALSSPVLPTLVATLLAAALVVLIVVPMLRRITRPLRRLAEVADRLGRGEAVEPLPEAGPAEVRRATLAFNRMQERLRRFVEDRTRMLAAIGHDLRTPITSLKLRAELLDDEEARGRILATLDEMQRMVEATLAFAREEASRGATRTVELGALVESVCADLADLGHDVVCRPGERLAFACRPDSLRRAVRNLVENAVRYGERARVAVLAETGELRIVVDDDGPGIPDAARERVFAPFVRLEESRSGDTGGVGLGLAIARTIARAHGGDVRLTNRTEGGLRAEIVLPLEAER